MAQIKKPRFTIVTCTYNRVVHIEKCLKSIENQTFTDIEHVINDSFSTDGTVEIIKKYIEKNKNKYTIKFFQTKPQGIARALNDALKRSNGEIIHFLHSDDYYYTDDALERVDRYFSQNPALGWLTGNHVTELRGKIHVIRISKLLRLSPKRIINSAMCVSHENTFVKTDLVKKYGGFEEKNKITVEYRLWLNLIQDYMPLVLDEEFTVFIIHKGSASHKNLLAFSKGALEMIRVLIRNGIIPTVGPYKKTYMYKQTYEVVMKTKRLIKRIEELNGKLGR